MIDDQLHNVDSEDLDDWLMEVEKSFNFQFADNELAGVQTFGQLSDHIISKLSLVHSDDCTTQQAFYKLRLVIRRVLRVDSLTPHTLLWDILPHKGRIRAVRQLERELGFALPILEPPGFVTNSLLVLLLSSLPGFISSFQIGISILLTSITGFWLANYFGKELTVRTVGELAERITKVHYAQSRRDAGTVNRNEIEKLLADWLCEAFFLSRSKLTREAKFV